MSYFRSYFEKNNTIVKNYGVNTAKNPTTDIFYGSGFSKYLFKVDFSDLITKIQRYIKGFIIFLLIQNCINYNC